MQNKIDKPSLRRNDAIAPCFCGRCTLLRKIRYGAISGTV